MDLTILIDSVIPNKEVSDRIVQKRPVLIKFTPLREIIPIGTLTNLLLATNRLVIRSHFHSDRGYGQKSKVVRDVTYRGWMGLKMRHQGTWAPPQLLTVGTKYIKRGSNHQLDTHPPNIRSRPLFMGHEAKIMSILASQSLCQMT